MASHLSSKNLIWLLAAMTMVIAPHLPRQPLWVALLCVATILWRLHLTWRGLRLPSRWQLALLTIAATGGTFLSHGTIFGRDPGVTLLILLTVMKLMEIHSQRDAMVVIFLGYFIVITHFFYSQTIPAALYMLLVVLMITATLVGFNHTAASKAAARFKLAGLLLAQSVPLMLVLFVFFPRVSGPLWGVQQETLASVSGLSDTMAPGSISQLIRSDAVAFRARFEDAVPGPDQLYWRGPVMWHFNGKIWSPGGNPADEPFQYETLGRPVGYEVTLEPHRHHWLFALDLPALLPPESSTSGDYQILARTPVTSRLRYAMASHLSYRAGLDADSVQLQRALQLPPAADVGSNPRARALAESWRQRLAGDEAIMRAALAMFRDQQFHYTLQPPLLNDNTVDEFLFDTRQGFCEHYSSSFAFLMRAAGIPARIVTGYLGGEIDPASREVVVRQSDAHAWTEVWLKQRGWVRADPTAAVVPERIESGIAAAVPTADPLSLVARVEPEWLRNMHVSLGAIAGNWNHWVLGYSPQRQMEFLARAGMKTPDWKDMTAALAGGMSGLLLVFAAVMLRRLRQARRDPVQTAYLKFCDKLASKGLPRQSYEGPRDYAARLARLRPDIAPATNRISALYIALRYGTLEQKEAMRELQRRVAEFRF